MRKLTALLLILVLAACSRGDVAFTPQASPAIRVSESPSGSPYVDLHGATLSGGRYIFVPNVPYLERVSWVLDGEGYDTDRAAPWSPNSNDGMFNTARLADGQHTITARYFYQQGGRQWEETVSATFTVANKTVPPEPEPAPEPDPVDDATAMPVGDLPGWTQIFTDDFTTPSAEGDFLARYPNWDAYPKGWKDTSKKGTYSPEIVSVRDGILRKRLHTDNGVVKVAALEPVLPGGTKNQLYGRYSVRFRADSVAGYKVAWLLWPESGVWPRDGEIDFPEGNLTGRIHAFMHRQGGTSGGDQDVFSTNATFPQWHIATTEWSPSSVIFYLDGVEIGRSTSRIPNTPMRWVLQTETNLDGDSIDPQASGFVEIDWIAVWKRN